MIILPTPHRTRVHCLNCQTSNVVTIASLPEEEGHKCTSCRRRFKVAVEAIRTEADGYRARVTISGNVKIGQDMDLVRRV